MLIQQDEMFHEELGRNVFASENITGEDINISEDFKQAIKDYFLQDLNPENENDKKIITEIENLSNEILDKLANWILQNKDNPEFKKIDKQETKEELEKIMNLNKVWQFREEIAKNNNLEEEEEDKLELTEEQKQKAKIPNKEEWLSEEEEAKEEEEEEEEEKKDEEEKDEISLKNDNKNIEQKQLQAEQELQKIVQQQEQAQQQQQQLSGGVYLANALLTAIGGLVKGTFYTGKYLANKIIDLIHANNNEPKISEINEKILTETERLNTAKNLHDSLNNLETNLSKIKDSQSITPEELKEIQNNIWADTEKIKTIVSNYHEELGEKNLEKLSNKIDELMESYPNEINSMVKEEEEKTKKLKEEFENLKKFVERILEKLKSLINAIKGGGETEEASFSPRM